ncbi:MAG TPA: MFS transporter [Terriglobales bacterium]|nr:MFS transporter [Terriglobales bacterium]
MPFIRLPGDGVVVRSTTNDSLSSANVRSWILAATILASSMAFIDGTVVNVALPSLQSSLHATVVDVQWVVESYGLLLAALILVGGSLGDMWGRRLMFLTGVVVFALASAGCGFASNISQLVIARSIQGVGAAFLVPGSLSIISASFDENDRGQAIGTWSGFTSITTAIGPVLGGWLIQHASWRWAFFINLPIAVAVIVISLWNVPESRSASADRVDWVGALIVTLGLGGLVYGFVESANLGWGNPRVFGSLIGGVACLTIFAMVEVREKSPMVPPALFASRTFSGANLLTLFLYSAIGIFFFLFPLDLIQVQGYSATAAGAAMLPLILILFLLSRWSGGLVARYGPKVPLIVGPLIAGIGFALFVLSLTGGSYWKEFFPAIIVLGFGMAVTVAPLTTVLMNSVAQDRIGAASGINNTVARVASVLAIAVLGIVMVNAFRSHLNPELAKLSLPSATLHEIQDGEINLAGLELPAGLDTDHRNAVREAVHASFVHGFRMIMWICAGLSVASAMVAWTMISANTLNLSQKPRPLA